MARYNQSSGRTPQAWARRYDRRRKQMENVAAKLGGTLEVDCVGGVGVPGKSGNHFIVVLADGTRLERREAKKRVGA